MVNSSKPNHANKNMKSLSNGVHDDLFNATEELTKHAHYGRILRVEYLASRCGGWIRGLFYRHYDENYTPITLIIIRRVLANNNINNKNNLFEYKKSNISLVLTREIAENEALTIREEMYEKEFEEHHSISDHREVTTKDGKHFVFFANDGSSIISFRKHAVDRFKSRFLKRRHMPQACENKNSILAKEALLVIQDELNKKEFVILSQ